MAQGLAHGHIGIGVFHVLADDGDGHGLFSGVHAVNQVVPLGQFPLAVQGQGLGEEPTQSELFHDQGHFVHVADGGHGEDGFGFHVAEEGELFLDAAGNFGVAAADEGVGLDADAAQFFYAVLGGFGFQFFGGGDVGQEGEVDVEDVVSPHGVAHLSDGFEEGQSFDVAHGAADFDDDHVGVGLFSEANQAVLYFVGEMGHGLDGAAEEVAATLAGNQFEVGLAGGYVAVAGQLDVDEAFVVAEVEVGFAAVPGDEDLAMLVGRHGAGVNVEVGVELDDGNGKPLAFEDAPDGGDADALADGADHAPGHEDVLSGHRYQTNAAA